MGKWPEYHEQDLVFSLTKVRETQETNKRETLQRETSWFDTLFSSWFYGGKGRTLWPSCPCAIWRLQCVEAIYPDLEKIRGTTVEAAVSVPFSQRKSLYFTESWETCPDKPLADWVLGWVCCSSLCGFTGSHSRGKRARLPAAEMRK